MISKSNMNLAFISIWFYVNKSILDDDVSNLEKSLKKIFTESFKVIDDGFFNIARRKYNLKFKNNQLLFFQQTSLARRYDSNSNFLAQQRDLCLEFGW